MRLSWAWIGPTLKRDTAPVEQAVGATLTMPQSAQMRDAT